MNSTSADEDTPPPEWVGAIVWPLVSLACMLAVAGNVLVLFSYFAERAVRQPSNYFIASLASADLLIAVDGFLLFTYNVFHDEDSVVRRVWLCVDCTLSLVAKLTVLLITLDRFCSVCITRQYRKWQSSAKIKGIIVLSWLVPAAAISTVVFGLGDWIPGELNLNVRKPILSKEPILSACICAGSYWLILIAMVILYRGIHRTAKLLQARRQSNADNRHFVDLVSGQKPLTHLGVGLLLHHAQLVQNQVRKLGVDGAELNEADERALAVAAADHDEQALVAAFRKHSKLTQALDVADDDDSHSSDSPSPEPMRKNSRIPSLTYEDCTDLLADTTRRGNSDYGSMAQDLPALTVAVAQNCLVTPIMVEQSTWPKSTTLYCISERSSTSSTFSTSTNRSGNSNRSRCMRSMSLALPSTTPGKAKPKLTCKQSCQSYQDSYRRTSLLVPQDFGRLPWSSLDEDADEPSSTSSDEDDIESRALSATGSRAASAEVSAAAEPRVASPHILAVGKQISLDSGVEGSNSQASNSQHLLSVPTRKVSTVVDPTILGPPRKISNTALTLEIPSRKRRSSAAPICGAHRRQSHQFNVWDLYSCAMPTQRPSVTTIGTQGTDRSFSQSSASKSTPSNAYERRRSTLFSKRKLSLMSSIDSTTTGTSIRFWNSVAQPNDSELDLEALWQARHTAMGGLLSRYLSHHRGTDVSSFSTQTDVSRPPTLQPMLVTGDGTCGVTPQSRKASSPLATQSFMISQNLLYLYHKRRKQLRAEHRARKAFRTISIIIGTFALFWSPYYVLATVKSFRDAFVPSAAYVLSCYLCYLSAAANPFCYSFANRQFRLTFIRILRRDFRRR